MIRPGILERVKRRIDPTGDIDNDIEQQLVDIIEDTTDQLCVKLGGVDTVPDSLGYIIVGVSVNRYNRIGSEGTASHTVQGETMAWSADPFSEYMKDIEEWRNSHNDCGMHVKFI